MTKQKFFITALLTLILVPALAAPAITTTKNAEKKTEEKISASTTRQFTYEGTLTDGTPYSFTIVAMSSEEGKIRAAAQAATSRILNLDKEISAEDGVVANLDSLPQGKSLKLSKDVFGMVEKAVQIAAQTNGWFDITAPSPKNWFIKRDWRRIVLDHEAQTISFKNEDMKLDLARIARGYMVDIAMDELQNSGIANALVEVGHISRNIGRDIFTPWSVQIGFGNNAIKFAHRALQYKISNIAMATVSLDDLGQGLIDAHSKEPVPALKFFHTTTFAPDATTATAYAIAVFALGPKNGFKFIQRHPEIKGIIVDNDGNFFASIGLGATSLKKAGTSDQNAEEPKPDGGPNDMRQKQIEEEKDF